MMRYFKLAYHFETESTTVRCADCDENRRRYTPLADFTGKEMYEWLDKHVRGYHPTEVPPTFTEGGKRRWKSN